MQSEEEADDDVRRILLAGLQHTHHKQGPSRKPPRRAASTLSYASYAQRNTHLLEKGLLADICAHAERAMQRLGQEAEAEELVHRADSSLRPNSASVFGCSRRKRGSLPLLHSPAAAFTEDAANAGQARDPGNSTHPAGGAGVAAPAYSRPVSQANRSESPAQAKGTTLPLFQPTRGKRLLPTKSNSFTFQCTSRARAQIPDPRSARMGDTAPGQCAGARAGAEESVSSLQHRLSCGSASPCLEQSTEARCGLPAVKPLQPCASQATTCSSPCSTTASLDEQPSGSTTPSADLGLVEGARRRANLWRNGASLPGGNGLPQEDMPRAQLGVAGAKARPEPRRRGFVREGTKSTKSLFGDNLVAFDEAAAETAQREFEAAAAKAHQSLEAVQDGKASDPEFRRAVSQLQAFRPFFVAPGDAESSWHASKAKMSQGLRQSGVGRQNYEQTTCTWGLNSDGSDSPYSAHSVPGTTDSHGDTLQPSVGDILASQAGPGQEQASSLPLDERGRLCPSIHATLTHARERGGITLQPIRAEEFLNGARSGRDSSLLGGEPILMNGQAAPWRPWRSQNPDSYPGSWNARDEPSRPNLDHSNLPWKPWAPLNSDSNPGFLPSRGELAPSPEVHSGTPWKPWPFLNPDWYPGSWPTRKDEDGSPQRARRPRSDSPPPWRPWGTSSPVDLSDLKPLEPPQPHRKEKPPHLSWKI